MWDLLTSRVRERKIMDKFRLLSTATQRHTGPDFKIELLEGGKMPTKANPTDACWDCYAATAAYVPQLTSLDCMLSTAVSLGFKLEIPEGWEVQLRGRSGLASMGCMAHLGTIDHTYRRVISVLVYSVVGHYFNILPGDRVCQMSFSPVYQNKLVEGIVTPSSRGGFGSTGK
jgi:deoxyuridine 5'-triphosphate nucleotidohydrolase